MAFTQKDMSGALFKNAKKTEAKHPDYTGSMQVGGIDYWISAWIKKGDKGTFMSLAFKIKEAKAPAKPVQRDTAAEADDDGIPF